jgi:ABC-type branched-subunit amino acid transport system ATPase component|tara:strand:- start:4347 stop:5072 length:726 start_codon:yes stop_codon:yes gene_type:complete
MSNSALTLKNVFAGYGGGMVLQGLDLEVRKGSITCIVGPNGAGKSTVFRVISGLLKASEGDVLLAGESIKSLSPAEILENGVTQVPQSRALFPEMSVKENILMGGYLIRKNPKLLKERMAMVEEMIPIVRERASQPAGHLSGGQRRMVEIARTLILDPSLILMDEPSLGLDPKSVALVSELIKRMTKDGRTVLLIEQNVRLGMYLANDGVVMEAGKVRISAPAKDIAGDPEVASMYLGKTK